jgi:hypothetical protein
MLSYPVYAGSYRKFVLTRVCCYRVELYDFRLEVCVPQSHFDTVVVESDRALLSLVVVDDLHSHMSPMITTEHTVIRLRNLASPTADVGVISHAPDFSEAAEL